jgi:hypothetical protein
VGPAHIGVGFTDDAEHGRSIGQGIATGRRSLSIQSSQICLSGSLPLSNGIFGNRMAGWVMGRIQDGAEARRLLSRLLLGIDWSPVCLWRDALVMGHWYRRLCWWRRSLQGIYLTAALAVFCSLAGQHGSLLASKKFHCSRKNSSPQLGQVRWHSGFTLLTPLIRRPQPKATPRSTGWCEIALHSAWHTVLPLHEQSRVS